MNPDRPVLDVCALAASAPATELKVSSSAARPRAQKTARCGINILQSLRTVPRLASTSGRPPQDLWLSVVQRRAQLLPLPFPVPCRTIGPLRPLWGFYEYLPAMYSACSSIHLVKAVEAAALAHLANTSSIDRLAVLARRAYGKALLDLGVALRSKTRATADETLATLNLLANYEVLSFSYPFLFCLFPFVLCWNFSFVTSSSSV